MSRLKSALARISLLQWKIGAISLISGLVIISPIEKGVLVLGESGLTFHYLMGNAVFFFAQVGLFMVTCGMGNPFKNKFASVWAPLPATLIMGHYVSLMEHGLIDKNTAAFFLLVLTAIAVICILPSMVMDMKKD